MRRSGLRSFIFIALLFWIGAMFAKNGEPITVNAFINATAIEFSPNIIPENTPFIIHVINKAGAPVELENSDTSVEVYANMDKTYKVGLPAGHYIFFNDFNAHTKAATLIVEKESAILKSTNTPYAMGDRKGEKRDSPPSFRAIGSADAQDINRKPLPLYSAGIAEILFIVWRESVEALLVVGVVYSWLNQLKTGRRSGLFFMWMGVVTGLLCAILLSFLLITVNHTLSPISSNLFQAGMTLLAASMIVYMVKWMRGNSRSLKKNMHNSLEKNSSTHWRNISILTVVTVAVTREASEACIFIYGLGANSNFSANTMSILGLGVLLAIGTIFLLQLGNKIFSWRFFFKITEILLLLLGGGLLLSCIDRLILSGFLTPLHSKVWNTSFLISEGGFFAPMLSSFAGYRATPSLMNIIIYGAYWIVIYFLLKTKKAKSHAL